MKAELQAKFLQHLIQRKQDKGFTLIELLVVVIIIGILAAIALPTFLNQSAKAKQSEAKSVVSFVNTSQTILRSEAKSFALSFSGLALGLPSNTSTYTYTVAGGTDSTTITAQAGDTALKGYVGGSVRFANTDSQSAIANIICEAKTPSTGIPLNPTLDPTQSNPVNAAQCNSTTNKL